ncbi:MAG: hypothetical protein NTY19_20430 [Planctomycetota bacterium]|nr:hypothetical protein [Planctomycetota bacterium]
MTPEKRFAELWTDYLEGDLDDAGLAELHALLAADESLQAQAVELFQTHRLLGFALQENDATAEAFVRATLARLPQSESAFVDSVLDRVRPATMPGKAPKIRRPVGVLARPLVALTAGVVLGVLCTSVLWAYAGTDWAKVRILLDESFESGPAPLVTGVPTKPDVWSGDYSEVVGEEQGVEPVSGERMLRFLRADHEGKARDEGYVGEVYRLLDLRPWQTEIADGNAVVEVSASFNAAPFPSDERYEYGLMICALDHEIPAMGPTPTTGQVVEQSVAVSRRYGEVMDQDPSTWQRVTTEMRLPPKAHFIMVRLSVARTLPRGHLPAVRFAGHYADGVRVSFARRAPLP